MNKIADRGSGSKSKTVDPGVGNLPNIPPSVTAASWSKLSPEVSRRSLRAMALELGLDWPKEGSDPEAFEFTDVEQTLSRHLEVLLLSSLLSIFQCAIKQITEFGYSEEVAEKAVSRGGLYLGGNEPMVNIVNDSLHFLEKGKGIDVSRDERFDNLQQLAQYTMLEIVGVLREIRPSLSIPKAMWWLLVCDLNVSQACVLGGDPWGNFSCEDVSGDSSSSSAIPQSKSKAQSSGNVPPSPRESKFPKRLLPRAKIPLPETLRFQGLPNLPKPDDPLALERVTPEEDSLEPLTPTSEKPSSTTGESVQIASQTCASEENEEADHKGSQKEPVAIRQKCFSKDKNYSTYGFKGAFQSGKLTSFGDFSTGRKPQPPSELAGGQAKNVCSNKSTEVPAEVPLADGSRPVSKTPCGVDAKEKTHKLPLKETVSMSPPGDSKVPISLSSEKKSNPKPLISSTETPKIPDYYAGIPYDNSLGKYVARDEKEEMILKLVPRLQELQDELQGWTEWANQKVMLAAHRLRQDQHELKALRLRKEEAGKYKKEKQTLEENTMKRVSEMENTLLNSTGEVEKAKSTVHKLDVENLELKRELDAAKLWALESAASIREVVEREQMAQKRVQSLEGRKALLQEGLERENCKIAELQQEISKAKSLYDRTEARLKQDKTATEILLAQAASIREERAGLEARAKADKEEARKKAEDDMQKDMEHIQRLEKKLSELKLKSNSSSLATPHVLHMQNSSGTRGLKQERECAMCLSEELSVVFLPCAHQVLCAKCNELHEKRGMKDCPSCRTPIQWRINARFACPPQQHT